MSRVRLTSGVVYLHRYVDSIAKFDAWIFRNHKSMDYSNTLPHLIIHHTPLWSFFLGHDSAGHPPPFKRPPRPCPLLTFTESHTLLHHPPFLLPHPCKPTAACSSETLDWTGLAWALGTAQRSTAHHSTPQHPQKHSTPKAERSLAGCTHAIVSDFDHDGPLHLTLTSLLSTHPTSTSHHSPSLLHHLSPSTTTTFHVHSDDDLSD